MKYSVRDAVVEFLQRVSGKILDAGSGDGNFALTLKGTGKNVIAFDMDEERFGPKGEVPFIKGNFNEKLPFGDEEFDAVVFMEVIEHIYNPDQVVGELSRILKKNGFFILTTPNILNISSRLRFLFEGSYDFFREPILDYSKCFPMELQNMHVIPWRYHDLEYLLAKNGMKVFSVKTDYIKPRDKILTFVFWPILFLQAAIKNSRSGKKEGISFKRINDIILSGQMLGGKHLILIGQKVS